MLVCMHAYKHMLVNVREGFIITQAYSGQECLIGSQHFLLFHVILQDSVILLHLLTNRINMTHYSRKRVKCVNKTDEVIFLIRKEHTFNR